MPEPAPKSFYITTPIYYVNAPPHIGHAYTTVAADMIARWHRQRQEPVWFLTGTDEHGQKVLTAAEENGVEPQEWADRLVETSGSRCSTSSTRQRRLHPHHRGAAHRAGPRVLADLYDDGDVYEGSYEGPYCVALRGVQAARRSSIEGRRGHPALPDPRRPVEMLSEANYFFGMSALRRAAARPLRGQPDVRAARRAPATRSIVVRAAGAAGPLDLALHVRLGHPGAVGRDARALRLDRRAAQLRDRGRLRHRPARGSSGSGRPTSTSSARTSCASTPSSGRRC